MNCPRCKKQLTHAENKSVKLDVCYSGCGGVWFDWLELKKLDEVHEADPQFLQYLAKGKYTPASNTDQKINCPTCPNQPMMRHFWSTKRQVEVDECAKCGGFWLDAGELTHIHSLYETESERKQAASAFYDEMFGADVAKLKEETQKDLAKAKAVANALRFICPTYYIPGKQKGGAF